MSLMSKLSITTLLLVSSLYSDVSDKLVLDFEKARVSKGTKLNVKDVSIFVKQKTELKDWYGYVFNIKAEFNGKPVDVKDVVFSNGKIVATDLFDMKTGQSFKDDIAPKITEKYYDETHLIAGNMNAKNTLVIFSDPLCPFCIDYVPEVIKTVKKNPNDLRLFYYHFPLEQIHPAALTIARAMTALRGTVYDKDLELAIYEADFEKYFTEQEKNEKKILDAINKVLKTKLEIKDIQNPKVNAELAKDIKGGEDLMVPGTPTIYVNGELDRTKKKYETLVK